MARLIISKILIVMGLLFWIMPFSKPSTAATVDFKATLDSPRKMTLNTNSLTTNIWSDDLLRGTKDVLDQITVHVINHDRSSGWEINLASESSHFKVIVNGVDRSSKYTYLIEDHLKAKSDGPGAAAAVFTPISPSALKISSRPSGDAKTPHSGLCYDLDLQFYQLWDFDSLAGKDYDLGNDYISARLVVTLD